MADVPKDIMETARDVYERLFRLGAHSKGLVVRDPLGLIAGALLSERERRTAQGVTDEPFAWSYSLLMHDSMGGWEQKITRYDPRTSSWIKPDEIRDLRPLFAAPSLSTSAGGGERG